MASNHRDQLTGAFFGKGQRISAEAVYGPSLYIVDRMIHMNWGQREHRLLPRHISLMCGSFYTGLT